MRFRFLHVILSMAAIGRLGAEPDGAELLASGLQPRVEGIPARLTGQMGQKGSVREIEKTPG